jgi:hypothetical protein
MCVGVCVASGKATSNNGMHACVASAQATSTNGMLVLSTSNNGKHASNNGMHAKHKHATSNPHPAPFNPVQGRTARK